MTRFFTYISIILIAVGCTSRLDESLEPPLVVKGYLFGGERISDIFLENIVTSREFQQQENLPIENAEIKIFNSDTTIILLPDPSKSGCYFHPEYVVEVGKTYFLEVVYEDKILTSNCYVPNFLEVDSEFDAVTSVGQSDMPETIVSLNWEVDSENDLEFLLALSVEEETLEPLEFNSSDIRFEEKYSLPFKGNSAELKDIDFSFKGLHKLTIYSLSPEYSDYVRYAPDNFDRVLFNAPNNISNGFGVFAGLTGTTLEFTLVE